MVRFSRLFGTVAFVSSLIVVSAFAESSSGSAKPDIIRANGCFFFDANGAVFEDPGAELLIVFTNNTSGAYAVTCRGELPEGAVLPTGVMHWDSNNQPGFSCIGVDDWRSTTFPSGRAQFTCNGRI